MLRGFKRRCFRRYTCFDLSRRRKIYSVFHGAGGPLRVVRRLSCLASRPVLPRGALLVLSRVRSYPRTVDTVGCFYRGAPRCIITYTNSLLKLAFNRRNFSFPINGISRVGVCPIAFSRFLRRQSRELCRCCVSVSDLRPLPSIFFSELSRTFATCHVSNKVPTTTVGVVRGSLDNIRAALHGVLRSCSLSFIGRTAPLLTGEVSRI